MNAVVANGKARTFWAALDVFHCHRLRYVLLIADMDDFTWGWRFMCSQCGEDKIVPRNWFVVGLECP